MGVISGVTKHTISVRRDRYLCEGDVATLPNGEVLTVFCDTTGHMHPDHDDILLARSWDGGVTWPEEGIKPVWKRDRYEGGNNPCITRLSDGTLLIYFLVNSFIDSLGIKGDYGPQSYDVSNLRDCEGCHFTRSVDGGLTWGPLYKCNTAPMKWGQPADGLVEMPDGTLYMALSGLKSNTWMNRNGEKISSFLMRSDDKGLNWEYYSTIAHDPFQMMDFHEPSLTLTKEGLLVCVMRTVFEPRNRHGHSWISHSRDEGESWSRPEPTNIWGYPFDLLTLRDGRVLATYGHRREPFSLKGCISPDGIAWDAKDEFVIVEGGEEPTRSVGPWWHIGYPASCQLGDGSILTVSHEWTGDRPYVQYMFSAKYRV
ncbi:MAG: glycoside hydrolase [Oscillospiraceae bacterium]|nr:glycoside hydrolase [Oscillospiraceae bacterium]